MSVQFPIVLQTKSNPFITKPISDEGIALCLEHYGELYRHLNPFNKACTTCDKVISQKVASAPNLN